MAVLFEPKMAKSMLYKSVTFGDAEQSPVKFFSQDVLALGFFAGAFVLVGVIAELFDPAMVVWSALGAIMMGGLVALVMWGNHAWTIRSAGDASTTRWYGIRRLRGVREALQQARGEAHVQLVVAADIEGQGPEVIRPLQTKLTVAREALDAVNRIAKGGDRTAAIAHGEAVLTEMQALR